MRAKLDVRGWARVVWALAALVLFGLGAGSIWWPMSQRIAQLRASARELYDEANAIDATTRRAAQLQAAETRVETDLRALGGVRSEAAVTTALLRLFHGEGERNGVDVRAISPGTAAETGVLAGTDLAVGMRGSFRNVIALVSDLPRHDVLVDVKDVQLKAASIARDPPLLDVTLHATVYRVTSLPATEGAHVRALR